MSDKMKSLDEEAVFRTIGVIAGVGLSAVSKYADDVADLTDDTFGSVYKKKIASHLPKVYY